MNQELVTIVRQFADCGWDLIDAPSKAWLEATDDDGKKQALISAIKQADIDCGSCGCDMDPLYKKALALLA